MAAEICAAVDDLVPRVGWMGEEVMHALMCVNHHAYAVFEGGGREEVAALRSAMRDLEGVVEEGSDVHDRVVSMSRLADAVGR